MKKRLLSLILVFGILLGLITALPVMASSEKTEGIYTYTIENGEATITDCDRSASGKVEIPATLGGYPVKKIGFEAFDVCEDITEVIIPDGVNSIGDWAFAWCESMTDVFIPKSVTFLGENAFRNCGALTGVVFSGAVSIISSQAFFNCNSLKTIVLPTGVTNIGDFAFSGCGGLNTVHIPEGVTNIGESAFGWCGKLTNINLPSTIKTIGKDAFTQCKQLTDINIPDGVVSIGETAFDTCGLKSLFIPASVTSIGTDAFCKCYGLDGITVDENNQYYCSVDGNLFNKDKTTFIKFANQVVDAVYEIPYGVTRIENNAFLNRSGLIDIIIPDTVTSIGEYAFCGCYVLTDIEIPANVTEIGYGAFSNCERITSITIPGGVKNISEFAFSSNNAATGITISEGVETIDNFAFSYCSGASSVVIPKTVKSIGENAFEYCDALTDVYYGGSESDWQNIAIGENNDCLINATIHYNSAFEETTPSQDAIYVMLDGDYVTFDVLPQIINGRTMVPIRAIFETMGATVDWDENTSSAICTKDDTTVIMTVDSMNMYINGELMQMDIAPVIVDSRTLAPARFVAEAFGAFVDWDGDNNTVIITTK